jgi:hypothetical protein
MAPTIPDLWPPEFGAPSVLAPASILRQQGILLGKHTKNVVLGKVYSRGIENNQFEHSFILHAPLLGFEKTILSVSHGLELYPARLALDPLLTRNHPASGEVIVVATGEEFLQKLGDVLKSEPVKEVIGSLLAQSEGQPKGLAWSVG